MVAGPLWLTFPACDPRHDISRPNVGRNDDMPHNAAGHLNDPPRSFPIPRMDPPPPIKDPSPPDDPPTSLSGSYGFPQNGKKIMHCDFTQNIKYLPPNINSWRLIKIPDDPKQGLLHWYPIIVCGTLVMQKGTAPFLLNTFTVTPSFLLGLKRYWVSPAVESHPLTWKHSFILTGSPCKGLRSKKWIKLLWSHTFPNIVTIFRKNTIS